MRRILVIGSGGAGKSTFARRLGRALGSEVIHLDAHYWQPGWVETPEHEWRGVVERLLGGESWVMDGNFSGTLEARLGACDTVIFLDMPRLLCLWRVIKRALLYRGRRRPDMAAGCREQLNWEFLRWVWAYPKRSRKKVNRLLEKNAGGKRVIRLHSRREVEEFLARVESA